MAFSELEVGRCERDIARFMARRRPPPHIRPELDLGCRIGGQSIELFEIRPHWDQKSEKLETPSRQSDVRADTGRLAHLLDAEGSQVARVRAQRRGTIPGGVSSRSGSR